MKFLKVLIWAIMTALLSMALYSIFEDHLLSTMRLHYGGRGGGALMVAYIPVIALALPLALFWAIKVIRRK